MNRYSLESDSRRWWIPSAAAGTLATAVVGLIVVLPATGNAIPVDTTRQGSTPTVPGITYRPGNSPCFMVRAVWNEALDGPQPTCGWGPEDDPDVRDDPMYGGRGGVVRPGLPNLP